MAAIVRAYVSIKTDPLRNRVILRGRNVPDRKYGYAEWQDNPAFGLFGFQFSHFGIPFGHLGLILADFLKSLVLFRLKQLDFFLSHVFLGIGDSYLGFSFSSLQTLFRIVAENLADFRTMEFRDHPGLQIASPDRIGLIEERNFPVVESFNRHAKRESG